MKEILKIDALKTSFKTETGRINAVDGVSLSLKKGAVLGLVGESGCGKSVTALSIMRLLPQPFGRIESGSILFDGKDLATLPSSEMFKIRGRRIAMIFQEPMTALNPVHRVGNQIAEVFRLHFNEMSKKEIKNKSIELLEKVGIPAPEKRFREYPHQISGGMRQRVMIAMALAGKPDILIADEPTTALDVTIQAQILRLIKELQHEYGMSVIFITHDPGVIAMTCDDVAVMYAGRIAENAPVDKLFSEPRHPYTKGILSSIPRLSNKRKTRLPIIEGMVPPLDNLPKGCRFRNRCPDAEDACIEEPDVREIAENHRVSCFAV